MVENTRNATVTVGTSSIEVAPDLTGARRTFIAITNVSTGGQVINLAVGQEAKASTGIQLSVGGVYSEAQDAGFKPTKNQITAISSGAGGTVAVMERVQIDGY